MCALNKRVKVKKYKVVIIGAGRIAAGFDTKNSKNILTHAHAFGLNSNVELVGIYDVDVDRTKKMAKKWGIKPIFDLSLLGSIKPDIVSICTPDVTHYEMLLKVLDFNPRLVICEKPLTTNVKQTKKIISVYKNRGVCLMLNFSRRYDLFTRKIQHKLKQGGYGKVLSANIVYTKGALHNGSHAIDLARFFFGKIVTSTNLYEISDYDRLDKSVSAFLRFENCPQFYLISADERQFSIFEFEIICERGRMIFNNFGFSFIEEKVVSDPVFSGYKMLGETKSRKTMLDRAMLAMVKNSVDFLNGKSDIWCPAEDALETQIACENLIKNKKYVR